MAQEARCLGSAPPRIIRLSVPTPTVGAMTEPQDSPQPPQLNAVGLVVADLPRAIEFYTALGCRFDELSPSGGHIEADLGGIRLMLDTDESIQGYWPGSTWPGRGRVSLAARCASPADVDRVHSELAKLGSGSTHEPFDAPWGMRYATVLDPDGSAVDLYADLS